MSRSGGAGFFLAISFCDVHNQVLEYRKEAKKCSFSQRQLMGLMWPFQPKDTNMSEMWGAQPVERYFVFGHRSLRLRPARSKRKRIGWVNAYLETVPNMWT